MAISLTVNRKARTVDVEPDKPLAVGVAGGSGHARHQVRLRRGAVRCVHGDPERRGGALLPDAARRRGRQGDRDDRGRGRRSPVGAKVVEAWTDLDVPQCGYCQAGQIMSATAMLTANAKPTADDVTAGMAGNICRCAT